MKHFFKYSCNFGAAAPAAFRCFKIQRAYFYARDIRWIRLLNSANCASVNASPRILTGTPTASIHSWICSLESAISGAWFNPFASVFLLC